MSKPKVQTLDSQTATQDAPKDAPDTTQAQADEVAKAINAVNEAAAKDADIAGARVLLLAALDVASVEKQRATSSRSTAVLVTLKGHKDAFSSATPAPTPEQTHALDVAQKSADIARERVEKARDAYAAAYLAVHGKECKQQALKSDHEMLTNYAAGEGRTRVPGQGGAGKGAGSVTRRKMAPEALLAMTALDMQQDLARAIATKSAYAFPDIAVLQDATRDALTVLTSHPYAGPVLMESLWKHMLTFTTREGVENPAQDEKDALVARLERQIATQTRVMATLEDDDEQADTRDIIAGLQAKLASARATVVAGFVEPDAYDWNARALDVENDADADANDDATNDVKDVETPATIV